MGDFIEGVLLFIMAVGIVILSVIFTFIFIVFLLKVGVPPIVLVIIGILSVVWLFSVN